MPPDRRNLVLTGIPRSGTTLLTALVDTLENSVALSEPGWQFDWLAGRKRVDPQWFAGALAEDFTHTRERLLQGLPVSDRRDADGAALTNYHRGAYVTHALRRDGLTADFTLGMKHVGPYMGALPQIVAHGAFSVIAMVRHPVETIASWKDVPIPAGMGKMPGAAAQWPELAALSRATMPLLEKQVRLYDMLCERLLELQGRITLFTYEQLVADPRIISRLLQKPQLSSAPRIEIRPPGFYGASLLRIAAMVDKIGVACKQLYPDAASIRAP